MNTIQGPGTVGTSASAGSSASMKTWQEQRESFVKIFTALRQADTTTAGKALEKATGTPATSAQGQRSVAGLASAAAGNPGATSAPAAHPLFSKPGRATPQSAQEMAAQISAAAGASPAANALKDAAG